MLINDLEHLKTALSTDEIQGGELPIGIDPIEILGIASSAFQFNSLSIGQYGSFAAGIPEILTTAVPGNFSVGFKFQYTSLALGYGT
ncbi:hypothetical protein C7H19_22735 [Aphanothece hegewaldii CCALA 016]|uniref:Uncharacterized protein n=1 Tax=Aphanothece hegewaldii CCALA 016 TaxID=2107694 RepID=A0A2T1LRM3_9CHRO|nr:hypothetical protein [Aphanothece hegewaldii]PSF31397.1 hypothetical protein C7H19_22735 [Aphanothece hegewaldii CCALA 016]